MPEHIPYLRVFISSPSDVTDERKIALDVIKRLPNRPSLRDRIAFRIVAWDEIGADTPMRATLTPQEAINQGLPLPSECDIVVVLFWSRMGTPFVHTDGQEYMSGTHWELLDALNSTRAESLIYRRTEEKLFRSDDKDGQDQDERVKAFFKSDLFYKEGRIVRGINLYASPDDFRLKFETHFEDVVVRLLRRLDSAPPRPADPAPTPGIVTVERDPWPVDKSPFPGLRAFTEADAEIYFGRGRETDLLVRRIAESRFVAVVGASGSGKSSLVGAGLIPRLRANAISTETTGSKDWFMLTLKPGKAPFEALAAALMETVPALDCTDPIDYPDRLERLTVSLSKAPDRLAKTITHALKGEKAWAEVLIFIDQFEELFARASAEDAARFGTMLMDASQCEKVRLVVTLRDDFFHRANAYQDLSELLQSGSFPLTMPRRDALRQMIERPAERAGLVLEPGLVELILDDTGDQPGGLALMAYALDELYKLGHGRITLDHYRALGGVKGAIGTRAEKIFAALPGAEVTKMTGLRRVFHRLVEVDERGTATRRRTLLTEVTADANDKALVTAFVEARLLVTSDTESHEPLLEVAHEALLRKEGWKRLADWIAEAQEDLILLRQVRAAADEWAREGKPDFLLWPAERLQPVYAMIERHKPDLSVTERDFIEPEQARLLRELDRRETTDERRRDIGDRLAVIGDTRFGISVKDGVPEIAWLLVTPGGEITIAKHTFTVQPFYIAQYQITYAQFQTFLDASDGFADARWWDGMPDDYKKQEMTQQRTKITNAPRDSVSWYQGVAFSRWVNHRLRGLTLVGTTPAAKADKAGLVPKMVVGENAEIRLPTEWEWQWVAQGGAKELAYPWGDWQEGFANTSEAGLSRTTAVGMYPHGRAECGALDAAGNLLEWCLNDHDVPEIVDGYSNDVSKVLRGGSFHYLQLSATATARNFDFPYFRYLRYGLRLAVCPMSAR